jgi:hypothetical protein
MSARRHEQPSQTFETAGFWMFGFLSMVLAVLK